MINPDGAKNSVLPITRDGIWKNRFFHPVFPAPTEFPSCLHPAPGAPSPWHMARKSGNFLKQSAGASLPERGTVENGAVVHQPHASETMEQRQNTAFPAVLPVLPDDVEQKYANSRIKG